MWSVEHYLYVESALSKMINNRVDLRSSPVRTGPYFRLLRLFWCQKYVRSLWVTVTVDHIHRYSSISRLSECSRLQVGVCNIMLTQPPRTIPAPDSPSIEPSDWPPVIARWNIVYLSVDTLSSIITHWTFPLHSQSRCRRLALQPKGSNNM